MESQRRYHPTPRNSLISSFGHRDDVSGPSSANSNMAAVAARIQERALQLQSERAKWDLAKVELEQAQSIAAKERQVNHSIRRTLLATTRSRHGIELELYEAQDQAHSCMQSIVSLQHEAENVMEQTEIVQERWEDAVRTTYASHQLGMEVYRHSLDQSLREREDRSSQRKRRLEEIFSQTAQLSSREEHLRDESKNLKREISDLESKEEGGDCDVASLATKVRELISKVRILAKVLKMALVDVFLLKAAVILSPPLSLGLNSTCREHDSGALYELFKMLVARPTMTCSSGRMNASHSQMARFPRVLPNFSSAIQRSVSAIKMTRCCCPIYVVVHVLFLLGRYLCDL
jgi:DNA repair exonuclease SbcCD ATPase subunit